jgi:DNA-binding protein H-NS
VKEGMLSGTAQQATFKAVSPACSANFSPTLACEEPREKKRGRKSPRIEVRVRPTLACWQGEGLRPQACIGKRLKKRHEAEPFTRIKPN